MQKHLMTKPGRLIMYLLLHVKQVRGGRCTDNVIMATDESQHMKPKIATSCRVEQGEQRTATTNYKQEKKRVWENTTNV